ncbi:unnamed protein product [Amaranthus hypochondriacus]
MATRHLNTVVYTRESTLYFPLFQKSQQNPRWLNTSSAFKPLYIVTPSQEVEISATVICSRENGLRVRVRSGGHDYEGLSYLSRTPFVLIDLVHLRDIEINMEDKTAWVQSGATLGELYYNIARKSNTYGYPAGVCPTVGVGGHISGGGIGALTRKYGVAADYVVNARLVDVNGRVLDRNLMGEKVFWAIRGGGGASFGVITAWKIRLVPVPVTVSVFTVHRSLEQGANKLIDKWQRIAHKLPEELFIRIIVQIVGGGGYGVKKTVQASFNSMFLGNIQSLMPSMKHSFPELEVKSNECKELSWIEAVLYFAGHPSGTPREALLDRDHQLYKKYFKGKSDFVNQPIPKTALQQVWDKYLQVNEEEEAKRHIQWVRMLHNFMSPYVSKSPRTAYFNYRDLDLGINGINETTSYLEARAWGTKYFKNNFERLAKAKSSIDPSNFFRDEQSIPPFS